MANPYQMTVAIKHLHHTPYPSHVRDCRVGGWAEQKIARSSEAQSCESRGGGGGGGGGGGKRGEVVCKQCVHACVRVSVCAEIGLFGSRGLQRLACLAKISAYHN